VRFTARNWSPRLRLLCITSLILLLCSFSVDGQVKEHAMKYPTLYRMTQVDGLSIFYREAGPKDAPRLLLLHGFPSSSRMFEPLFARLSDEYRLLAPDYPGFGHSDWPDPKQFAYTFDHIAEIMNHFTEVLGLSHYTLYMQDYGGPIGFRMALAHPERVDALIVQDAVAHNEGLGANWATRRAFWTDRRAHEEALHENLLSLTTTKTRHVGDDPKVELYDPDLWGDEFAFLNAPGQLQIQSDLFYDYRTNVTSYPQWQAWLEKTQPKLLILWGKHDLSFDPGEAERYRKDVPNAEVHIFDAGHFALDTKADEIAALIRQFMKNQKSTNAALVVGGETKSLLNKSIHGKASSRGETSSPPAVQNAGSVGSFSGGNNDLGYQTVGVMALEHGPRCSSGDLYESVYLAITTVVQELLSLGKSRFAALRISRRGCSPRMIGQ
jgi:pimeloyl-ACP methyl ester carboxylesterase